jgi:hypothetical protein
MRRNSVIHIAVVVLIAAFLFILPPLWNWSGLPVLVIAALIITTIIMVRWHSRNTGYRCPACQNTFMISPWTDFLSPHLTDRKMLRCPQCLTSGWCEEIAPVSVVPGVTPSRAAAAALDYSPRNLYAQIILIVFLYAALWITAFYQWSALSPTISVWHIFKIPIATAVLPVMHFVFCYYAIRRAYRSRVYALVTIFIAVFLLLAVWTQLRYLSGAS